MRLPDGPDLGLLLVRTDYSDQDAWRRALGVATAIYPGDEWRNGALLTPVEAPELNALTSNDIVQLPREGYLSAVAVADEQTILRHHFVPGPERVRRGRRAYFPCHPARGRADHGESLHSEHGL